MLSRLHSYATVGLHSELVTVDTHVYSGLSKLMIVGLGDTAVQESKERIRSAIRNSGRRFPSACRITVNLAPADIRKVGPRYDLSVALGILLASGEIDLDHTALSATVFLGELALDGSLRHVSGVLPVAMAARQRGMKRIIVPASNGPEAALVPGIEVVAPSSLTECIKILCREVEPMPVAPPASAPHHRGVVVDFSDVRGQCAGKRALEIAAAGGHNVLLSGVPGAGKTLLAQAFRGILPPLTHEEALEVTQIYSIADLLPRNVPLIHERPFRSVHHTASGVSIVGGGRVPGPGEITLAHHGVLFLDELTEFPASVLEVLRQPLENRCITITRASGRVSYPASFTLIAAMNPPHYAADVSRARRRISAPLLDRIDLMVGIQPVDVDDLSITRKNTGECSMQILERVIAARERQRKRFYRKQCMLNAQMSVRMIEQYCSLSQECERLLVHAARRLNLSARGYHRILKVSRTIADLSGAEAIAPAHLAEALHYREEGIMEG